MANYTPINFTPNTPLKVSTAKTAASINLPKNYVPQMSYNTPSGAALYGNLKPTTVSPQVKALQNTVNTNTLQKTITPSVIQPATTVSTPTYNVQPVQNTASILASTAKPVATVQKSQPVSIQTMNVPQSTSSALSSPQTTSNVNYAPATTNTNLSTTSDQLKALNALLGGSSAGLGGGASAGGSSSGMGSGGSIGGFSALSPSGIDYSTLNALNTKYEESLKPSAEEDALQKTINKINESMRLGLTDIEGQAIPMPFITGQSAMVEKQGLNKLQTLQDQLALFQANRANQQKIIANQIQNENEKIKATQEANKPIAVGSGSALINPSTGQVMYQAPSTDQILTPSEANLLGVPYGTTRSQAAQMNIIPKSASEIANESGLTPQQTSTFLTITNKYQASPLIQAFDKGQGLSAVADQVIANPENATNQLKSLYVLVKNLDPESAVREGELALANNTQSYLQRFSNEFAKITEGRVISPETAKNLAMATKELVSAWEVAKQATDARYKAQSIGAGIGDAFNTYLQNTSANYGQTYQDATLQSDLQILRQSFPNYTDDQLIQLRNKARGFNNVGGDTKKAIEAIGQFESGGNYRAIGQATSTGDRAYGKYQIMGANIPSWTKEALGYSMTPQQFLNNSNAQDKVAEYKVAQLIDKYGNLEDVASVWFSGQPLSKAGNKKDVVGTSVPKYVNNVVSIYNNLV